MSRRRYDRVTTITGNPQGSRAERRMAIKLARKKPNGQGRQSDPGPDNFVQQEQVKPR